MYATNFGYSGTYYDYITDIANEGISFKTLVNLDITDGEIEDVLVSSGFSSYRLEGSKKWIRNCIEFLKKF